MSHDNNHFAVILIKVMLSLMWMRVSALTILQKLIGFAEKSSKALLTLLDSAGY